MFVRLARQAQKHLGYAWSVTRPVALDASPGSRCSSVDGELCSPDDATWWDLSGLGLRSGWYMLDVSHSRLSIGCRLTLHIDNADPEHLLLTSKKSCKRIIYLDSGLRYCRISIDQPGCHLEHLAFIGLTARFAASRLRQRLYHRGQGSSVASHDLSSLYAAYRSHLHRTTQPVHYCPPAPILWADMQPREQPDRSIRVGLLLVPVFEQGRGGPDDQHIQPAIDQARAEGWPVIWHADARVRDSLRKAMSSVERWFLMPVYPGVIHAPDALCRLLESITADTVLLYADHDVQIEQGERCSPALKPEWNPDLLLSHDYIAAPWIVSLSWVQGFLAARKGSRTPVDIEQAIARISMAPASLLFGACLGISMSRSGSAAVEGQTTADVPKVAVGDAGHWPALRADQVVRVPAVLASLLRSPRDVTKDPGASAGDRTDQARFEPAGCRDVVSTEHWQALLVSALHEAGSLASIADDRSLNRDAESKPSDRVNPDRIIWPLPSEPPEVAIIVPTRDQSETLRVCIESVLQRTDYDNYRVYIVDNDSRESETAECFESLMASDSRVQVMTWSGEFNYSAINNHAVAQVDAPVIVLLNNDTEVISRCWLDEMTRQAMRPEIGCVGAKLYYSNRRIQHGGVIVGINGVAGHAHRYSRGDADGYCRRLRLTQNLTAVTAACLAIRRPLWQQLGGLDEKHLGVAWNDVDLCLRTQALGYRNLWTPHAELFHHEGLSRGADDDPAKRRRVDAERRYMMERWRLNEYIDPAYHPLLSTDDEGFALGDALLQPG